MKPYCILLPKQSHMPYLPYHSNYSMHGGAGQDCITAGLGREWHLTCAPCHTIHAIPCKTMQHHTCQHWPGLWNRGSRSTMTPCHWNTRSGASRGRQPQSEERERQDKTREDKRAKKGTTVDRQIRAVTDTEGSPRARVIRTPGPRMACSCFEWCRAFRHLFLTGLHQVDRIG